MQDISFALTYKLGCDSPYFTFKVLSFFLGGGLYVFLTPPPLSGVP